MAEIRRNFERAPSFGLTCSPDIIRTQQHFKSECDIHTILDKYQRTGILPVRSGAIYADVSGITDYQSAIEFLRQADAEFLSQPSSIRDRFHNNPQELVDFVNDSNNLAEAQKLGLVVQAPLSSAVVDRPQPASEEPKPSDG